MDKVRLHRRDPDHCEQVIGQGKATQERSGSLSGGTSQWIRLGCTREIRIIVRRDKSMDKVRLNRRDPDHCQEGQDGKAKAAQERSGSLSGGTSQRTR